jgi:hypothetical protein
MSGEITKEMIDSYMSHFSEEEIADIIAAEKSEIHSGFPSNRAKQSKRAKRRSSKETPESGNL